MKEPVCFIKLRRSIFLSSIIHWTEMQRTLEIVK
jgi:hypothetical protein